MKLSRTASYAIAACVYIAREAPVGGKNGPLAGTKIAEALGIPTGFLLRILVQLSRSHIIKSLKGPNGGYGASTDMQTKTLLDIVEAVEGPIALTHCLDANCCDYESGCTVRPHWPLINNALRSALAEIPLTRLTAQREAA